MDKHERQQAILEAIIREYIKTAKPVSSKQLALDFDCSPATVRNDMAQLEHEGFIMQPHTSAGRIPTEKGYQYYIRHFMHRKTLAAKKQQALQQALQKQKAASQRENLQSLAKTVAQMTDEAVVISFGNNNYFYTGLARLFRKPDFAEQMELLIAIGEVFDRIEDAMADLRSLLGQQDLQVLIGQDNPFPNDCSMIVSEYTLADQTRGMMGIVGPMRMDYDTNIAILKYMEQLMNHNQKRL